MSEANTKLYAQGGDAAYPKIILPDIPDLDKMDVYEANGGYSALKKALGMAPEAVTDEVKRVQFARTRRSVLSNRT